MHGDIIFIGTSLVRSWGSTVNCTLEGGREERGPGGGSGCGEGGGGGSEERGEGGSGCGEVERNQALMCCCTSVVNHDNEGWITSDMYRP